MTHIFSLSLSLSLSHSYTHDYSEALSRLAARKYARIIQKLGFPVCLNTLLHVQFSFYHSFSLFLRQSSLNLRSRIWLEVVMWSFQFVSRVSYISTHNFQGKSESTIPLYLISLGIMGKYPCLHDSSTCTIAMSQSCSLVWSIECWSPGLCYSSLCQGKLC